MLAAEIDGRDGLQIFRGIDTVMRLYRPRIALCESAGGAKSAAAAKSIHRSQQAVACAVYVHLEGLPLYTTPQRVQKAATGKKNASKDDVQAAMRERWPQVDFDKLLRTRPPYLDQGQRLPPPGKWENAFDACGVIHALWDHPTVAMVRSMAA